MDENAITNQPAEPQAQVQDNQGAELNKAFTQDELNEIVSKRVNKVKAKYEADLDEKLNQARAEWERQAKLSDEERLAEAQKQKIEELENRERAITLRERKSDATLKLANLQIPAEFVSYVVDLDEDKMNENIDNLSKVWNQALEKSVKTQLAGKTPNEIGTQNINNHATSYNSSSGITSI